MLGLNQLCGFGAGGVEVPTVIGQAFGGGYYAGQISTSANGVATHYLIVAPKATGENSSKQWKTAATSTAGTDSLFDGLSNSDAMNNASHPAAQFCRGLTIAGFTDWYLPAWKELEVLYFYLKPNTSVNNAVGSNAYAVSPEPISTNYSAGAPAQTSVLAFRSGGAEALGGAGGNETYWSSTQITSANAERIYFDNGNPLAESKSVQFYYVRAIRRVAI